MSKIRQIEVVDNLPRMRGFVDIQAYHRTRGLILSETEEFTDNENLILNNFRRTLPLLIAPRIITSRPDNSPGSNTWQERRIALVGFGVGDGATVKPEEPEDGATILVGEAGYPNSKLGLQGAMRRVPLVPLTPSEIHSLAVPVHGFYLLKEVDPEGFTINSFPGGGAEMAFTFSVLSGEYIGNILEYCLYLGGGDAADDTPVLVAGPDYDKVRLSRNVAIPIARKTRVTAIDKTVAVNFRLVWRIRT